MMVMVVQYSEYTKNHCTTIVKRVNFMVCELNSNKNVNKKLVSSNSYFRNKNRKIMHKEF